MPRGIARDIGDGVPQAVKGLPQEMIKALKRGLEAQYGQRLRKLVLYGSWARGEAGEGSDIDLAVVLAGTVQPAEEVERTLDLVTDLNLDYGVLLSLYPVSEEAFYTVRSPLLLNIHKEGLVL
ncbi:MAG: nucleotidyltransferase domain-containing protein [Deinococcota bacterium]|nr:nucleotidyltransferase domain-containing protein [Deinococcota bacterium]